MATVSEENFPGAPASWARFIVYESGRRLAAFNGKDEADAFLAALEKGSTDDIEVDAADVDREMHHLDHDQKTHGSGGNGSEEKDDGQLPKRTYGTKPAGSAAIESRCNDLEDILRSKLVADKGKKERGYALDADGSILWTSVGDEHSTKGDFARTGVAAFTHSHPNGSSFSAQDVEIAHKYGLIQMRAATKDGAFVLGPPASGWSSVDQDSFRADVARLGSHAHANAGIAKLAQTHGLYYAFEPVKQKQGAAVDRETHHLDHDQKTHGGGGGGSDKEKKGSGKVSVAYVGGETTYRLSPAATALQGHDDFVWEDDLLPSLDGQRPAGISETEPRDGDAKKLNDLAKSQGVDKGFAVDIRSNGRRVGIATVSRDRVNDKDYPDFIKAAADYMGGNGLSTKQERVLGKWLGFPKDSTDKYLARKAEWVKGRDNDHAGEPRETHGPLSDARRAAKAAEKKARDLVESRIKLETKRLDKEVRDVVRSQILKVVNGKQEAISPTAILNSIGLTKRQAETVDRARTRLLAEGKLKGKALEKDLDGLRVKLLRERANLIAEHETRFADALGQQAAWARLEGEGRLKGGARSWHKLWVASDDERTCGECMDLDGTSVPLDSTFEGEEEYNAPPEPHPRCRCKIVLVPASEGDSGGEPREGHHGDHDQKTHGHGGGGRVDHAAAADVTLPDGTLSDERASGRLPPPGVPFVVYRLGEGSGLGGTNAGNAEGVATHITNIADRGDDYVRVERDDYGGSVTAYRVVLKDPPGGYQPIKAGSGGYGGVGRQELWESSDEPMDKGWGPLAEGKPKNVGVWYSFAGSGFEATPIATIPVTKVAEQFGDFDPARGDSPKDAAIGKIGYWGSMSGGEAIRLAFRDALAKAKAEGQGARIDAERHHGDHDQKTHGRGGGGAKEKPKRPDTATLHKVNGQYTPERQAKHKEILDKVFAGKNPVEKPVMRMSGGGPASGKTWVRDQLGGGKDTVLIDADDMRKMLPEWEDLTHSPQWKNAAALTHEESSDLVAMALQRAVEGGYDTIYDGTGNGRYGKLQGKVEDFRNAGYEVIANYVTKDTASAWEGSKERAYKTLRWVPKDVLVETHASVSRIFPQATRDGLYDKWNLYDNNVPKGTTPKLIAWGDRSGRHLMPGMRGAYAAFLRKSRDGGKKK